MQGNLKEDRLGPTEIPVGLTTAFTAPEPFRLTNITLTNRSAGALTVTVYVVPAGASAANANILLGTVNLPGHDLLVYTFNIPLFLQDTIQYIASGPGINFFATITREGR